MLINYDFPPALSGVRRILKFCKYLPESGWQPEVLCAQPLDALGRDEDGAAEAQALGMPVHRTRSLDPQWVRALLRSLRGTARSGPESKKVQTASGPSAQPSWFFRLGRRAAGWLRATLIPDDRVGWVPWATWRGWRLLRRRDKAPTVILTSSFPHSAHLVGLLLQRLTGVLWVADFRDGWVQNPYFGPPATGLRRRLHIWLESQVVRRADAVIAVSAPIVEYLSRVRGREVLLLPNGFDPADYPEATDSRGRTGWIAYTGTFFGGRTPEPFFRALAELRNRGGQTGPVRAVLQTQLAPEHWECLSQMGLGDWVEVRPMGNHREALSLQREASLLLLMEPDGPGSEIMLTQKVFEYLGAQRPILAMVPEGACRDLLQSTGGAWITSPTDWSAAAQILESWLGGAQPPERNEAVIQGLTRSAQTRVLAQLLDRISQTR